MISSVIAEFNPFHNGHAYLLQKAKEESDALICVMSGNFVQRGDTAIFDKRKRTEFALKNGADLVISLPVGWSMSTAENFAFGGISLLKNTQIVDRVVFGSECSDINLLNKTADIISQDGFDHKVKEIMRDGVSYATARQQAVKVYSDELSHTLSKPNNTLAVEYILAAKKLGFSPAYCSVNRVGVEHNSYDGNEEYMSGSALRELIKSGDFKQIEKYVPTNILNDLITENFSDIERLNYALLFKIRSMSKEELSKIPDVSEGLENRIFDLAKRSKNLFELAENIKTKRYTLARIRRVLMCAAFGITNEFLKKEPPYIHILGCTLKGEELIKEIAKKSKLPLIISAKDALNLEGFAKKTFELEEHTSNLYSMSFSPMLDSYSEYSQKLIKI